MKVQWQVTPIAVLAFLATALGRFSLITPSFVRLSPTVSTTTRSLGFFE